MKLSLIQCVFVVLTLARCSSQPNETIEADFGPLTNEELATINNSILDRTSRWAEANTERNAEGVLALFLQSDELRHTENGVTFSSFDQLAEFVYGWYETTDEMSLAWEERDIFPISSNVAAMTGVFRYLAKQITGEVWAGKNVFTGVFVKEDGEWKAVHGHESSILEADSEGQI